MRTALPSTRHLPPPQWVPAAHTTSALTFQNLLGSLLLSERGCSHSRGLQCGKLFASGPVLPMLSWGRLEIVTMVQKGPASMRCE